MSYQQPQPVGGIFFSDPEDFSTKVAKIKRVAEEIRKVQMPEQIPLSKAKDIVARTFETSRELSDKAIGMAGDISNIFVSREIAAAVLSTQRATGSKIAQALFVDIIRPAQAAGLKTVPSRLFGRNVSSVLMSIAFSYEALQEIDAAKPLVLRYMPVTFGLIADIGRVFVILGNMAGAFVGGLEDTLDDIGSGLEIFIDILKWGSIAGGLYLLYKTMKPGKGKP